MRISQEEIRGYVEGFIRRAIRYEGDEDLGTVDKDLVRDQVRETVATALTLDPNAVYHLLGTGAREEVETIQSYLTTISEIEDLLPSLTAAQYNDPVTDELLSKVERALTFSALSSSSTARERTTSSVAELAKSLGTSLVDGDELRVPTSTAKTTLTELVTSLHEQHDIIQENLEGLQSAMDLFSSSVDLSDIRAKASGALQNLLDDMRFERLSTDDSAARASARQRFIELQAASVTMEYASSLIAPQDTRILSGELPAGTDVRMSASGESTDVISDTSTKSGGYDIDSGDTLELAVDGAAPATVPFQKTTLVNIIGKAIPGSPSISPKSLYFLVEIEGLSLGPHIAHIKPPGAYHAHGYVHLPSGGSSGMLGHTCSLRYTSDKQLLSVANKASVEANEGLVYRVVGYDGSTGVDNPRIKLDPPLPMGRFTPASILNEWEITLYSPACRWTVPPGVGGYSTYLDRLKAEFSGPTIPAKRDALQPWRAHTKITGTLNPGPNFVPGERVAEGTGAIQGIVAYHESSDLYLLEQDTNFAPTDTLIGEESGALMLPPLTIGITGVAEEEENAGQLNHSRFMEAVQNSSVFHIRGREILGGGADATLDDGGGSTGNLLTLNLTGAERGLWQLGLSNGDTLVVNNVEYVINLITSDTTALMTTTGLHTNVAWSARSPAPVSRIELITLGVKNGVVLQNITGLSGYDVGQPYVNWSVPRPGLEDLFAHELEMAAPQSDTKRWLTALELVEEVKAANISGLLVKEVRDVLYSHPEESAQADLTVGSDFVSVPTSLPSDSVAPDLTGYYFVPEEGEHSGRDFLIVDDLSGPRRLKIDTPARITETVPAYRIEARRIRLYTATRTTDGSVVFGAGTAHTKIGLPSSSVIKGTFATVAFLNKTTEFEPGDYGVIVGDVVKSPSGQFDDRTIVLLTGATAEVSPALSGDIEEAQVHVPGICPATWDNFLLELATALDAWQGDGDDLLNQVTVALVPISSPEVPAQVGDVGVFSRKLEQLKQAAEQTVAVLVGVELPDVPFGRSMLESLDENQLDRAVYLLTHGGFNEFLSGTKEGFTSSGAVQEKMKESLETLGIPTGVDMIEEEEEPQVVVDDLDFDSADEEGYLSDHEFDIEDDGEEI